MIHKFVDEIECGHVTCMDPDTGVKCGYLGKRHHTYTNCTRFRDCDGNQEALEHGTDSQGTAGPWELRCDQCKETFEVRKCSTSYSRLLILSAAIRRVLTH